MALTRVRSQLITIPTNSPLTGSLAGTASYATTASYALNGGTGGGGTLQTGSIAGQTILYNFSSSQEATITGLNLSNNKWGISVVEEWNSGSVLDIYFISSSLLLNFSGSNGSTTFTDTSTSPKTVSSVNGTSISTAQSKFGGSSGLFDGVDDYLIISGNTVCNFGSNDFTVECWVRLNAMPTSDAWPTNYSSHFVVITAGTPNAADGIGFIIGQTKLIVQSNDTQMPNALHGMTTNTWYHIAYVRRGNNLYFFVNGSQVGTTQTLTGAVGTGANTYIGCETTHGAFFNGYMDDLRVTNGIARYTSNFTTSSVQFSQYTTQLETKYIGSIGGLNDSNVDYGVQKLSDSSLKIRKMSDSGQPLSGSPSLSSSVDRVYVNVLNYDNVAITASNSITSSYALTASYALFNLNSSNINRVINGAMAIDQRNAGASQTITAAAALAYTVDRWYAYCTGANVTGQRVVGTGNNQYAYRFTGAASVTGIGFGQRIEAANSFDLAGSTVTLGVDLANSVLTSVTWTVYYANTSDTFGTLASPTRTQISTGTFTVNSTLSRYSTQIFIPSAATTGIEIVFSVGAQTSGTWTIDNVQLEAGPLATPFERRNIAQELVNCQRYYSKSYAINTVPGTVTNAGCIANEGIGGSPLYLGISIRLVVPMRITPNVTYYSPTSATSGRIGYWTGTAIGATTSYGSGQSGITDSSIGAQLINVSSDAIYWHYTANAEL